MGEVGSNRNGTSGTAPSPVPALAVPGNGVLGVLLVLHRAAVARPRVPRPDGQGFVTERGGEGCGVLHLFAVNDRPREALGVHPPVPHVVGADGGEVGHHTATAGPVLRHGFPFLLFHVHDDEPRPACRREPGHVREEGVGGHAVPSASASMGRRASGKIRSGRPSLMKLANTSTMGAAKLRYVARLARMSYCLSYS